jgi:hypothetical protein
MKTVFETDYYKKIQTVLDNINDMGLIERGVGHCLSMSDMVLKFLHKEGIKCELVECSLMVVIKNPPSLYVVGWSGTSEFLSKSQMENHVVCITKTPIPILIDCSVKNIDTAIPYICMPVVESFKHTNLVEYDFENSTWTYQQKPNSEIPQLHQQSILNRIKKDASIDKEIKFIKMFMFVLFTVSFLNFGRGMIDFYYTILHPELHPTRDLKIKQK